MPNATDSILAQGIKSLYRSTDCHFEVTYSHTKWAGPSNRYPARPRTRCLGHRRASLESEWKALPAVGGNSWSIASGILNGNPMSGPSPDGWKRTLLSTKTYSDVAFKAKVQKIGHEQIVVRVTDVLMPVTRTVIVSKWRVPNRRS